MQDNNPYTMEAFILVPHSGNDPDCSEEICFTDNRVSLTRY